MTGARTRSEKPNSVRIHELLADSLRRRLLLELADFDDPVCVDSLAEALADAPGSGGPGPLESTEPSSTALELHHCHLPKLDEAGWIEYDDESQTVRADATDATLQEELQLAIRELESIQSVFGEGPK